MPVDKHIRRMIQDLGQAFVQSMASSAQVSQAVRKIRREGYSIYLVLSSDIEGEPGAQIELAIRQTSLKEPVFCLDSNDVTFLESVGIDATRSARRRRQP